MCVQHCILGTFSWVLWNFAFVKMKICLQQGAKAFPCKCRMHSGRKWKWMQHFTLIALSKFTQNKNLVGTSAFKWRFEPLPISVPSKGYPCLVPCVPFAMVHVFVFSSERDQTISAFGLFWVFFVSPLGVEEKQSTFSCNLKVVIPYFPWKRIFPKYYMYSGCTPGNLDLLYGDFNVTFCMQ